MQQIQKVSSYLIWALNALLLTIPLLLLAQFTLIQWAPVKDLVEKGFILKPIETPEGLVSFINLTFTPLSWSIGFVGAILGVTPFFLGLLILKHLFQNYRKGHIFSSENVQKYKYLGWLCFLDGLLVKPISDMLMILMATLSNPPGHRYISLNFGTPNLEVLFWGMLVIVISWIMAEGYKLQKDQDLTI